MSDSERIWSFLLLQMKHTLNNRFVLISKEQATKGSHFPRQTKLLKINPLFIDKRAVYYEKIISHLFKPVISFLSLSFFFFKDILVPDYPLLFTSMLYQRWEWGLAFFCATLKKTVAKWFLQAHLCGSTLVEVDRGHMLIQWRMYGKEW